MKTILRSACYAVSACAAIAILAGCGGGGGTPLSPSLTGLTAERMRPGVVYKSLYSFDGKDGGTPWAGVVNVKGTLYGTTTGGGANCTSSGGCGTVFAITASGKEHVLYSFKGGSGDGANPYAGLIEVNGTFYGTTNAGGDYDSGCYGHGCGTVFEVSTSGKEHVLHSFKGGTTDGANPYAGLINVNGTLYATTSVGGGSGCSFYGGEGCGTVFSITPSGKETVLYRFGGGSAYDGTNPYAGLINVKGKLYGTTEGGGANGYGTVFSITPSGKERVLHGFGSGSGDGANPYAGLIEVNGTLYGTTVSGGTDNTGTAFKVTTSGKETPLHSFVGGSDGAYPYAGLIDVNGTLYGATSSGGPNNDDGTAFAITTSGKETVLHSFGGSGDGAKPYAGLINVNGTLYGTTAGGGKDGDGTVFKISP